MLNISTTRQSHSWSNKQAADMIAEQIAHGLGTSA